MDGKNNIRVTMLGQFTIQQEGMSAPQAISLAGRSGRLWTLIAYLILHRDRGVPAQELIDLLWPDGGGSNPASTLQNNVSRARAALSALGLPDGKELVRYEGGCYKWAADRETWLDADAFETFARQAIAAERTPEFLSLAKEASVLYQGDFLPEAATELWCVNLNTYYRSLYMRLCRMAARRLLDAQNYAEAVLLCAKVVHLDPMAEEFSVLLMRALTRSRQPQRALEHYEYLRQLYHDTYGMPPSAELEGEKHAAMQELYGHAMGEDELRAFLLEDHGDGVAFCCDNSTFREIVKLHLRAMRRNDSQAQLMMVRLESRMENHEKNAVYMKQMELTLQSSLRAGDPFTQLGASQFWVLLPDAAAESRDAITNRIRSNLHRSYPGSKALFSFKMLDLRNMKHLISDHQAARS